MTKKITTKAAPEPVVKKAIKSVAKKATKAVAQSVEKKVTKVVAKKAVAKPIAQKPTKAVTQPVEKKVPKAVDKKAVAKKTPAKPIAKRVAKPVEKISEVTTEFEVPSLIVNPLEMIPAMSNIMGDDMAPDVESMEDLSPTEDMPEVELQNTPIDREVKPPVDIEVKKIPVDNITAQWKAPDLSKFYFNNISQASEMMRSSYAFFPNAMLAVWIYNMSLFAPKK